MKTLYSALCVTAVLGGFTPLALAVTSPAMLKQNTAQAIEKFEHTARHHWSYDITRYENEEGTVSSSIERFDPRQIGKAKWSLIQVNSHTPTAKQQDEFASAKFAAGDTETSVVVKLADLIQVDSLHLLAEDEQSLTARFGVYVERLGRKASEQLQGVMTYAKTGGYIQHLTITNTASFSPVFGAEIESFTLDMAFLALRDGVFVKQVDLVMQGSMAWVIDIDEVSTDTYSNYQYWGDTL